MADVAFILLTLAFFTSVALLARRVSDSAIGDAASVKNRKEAS
jgi:hypothetical protein